MTLAHIKTLFQRQRSRITGLLPGMVIVVCLGGCERYQPMPLDQAAVDRGLSLADNSDLHARASHLAHPLLKPIELKPIELPPGDGLSPDEAAVLAVLINPGMRAQRDQHALSQSALLQAGILPNPQLTFSYEANTGGTLPDNINPYGFGLNYDITALIDHQARVHAAESAAQSVDLEIAWQEWQIAEAAKLAVYDLISLQAQRDVAAEVDHRLKENLDTLQNAAQLGLKTTIDLAAAETASRDAHAVVLQADRDVQHQQLALNRAMGLPPDTNVRLRKNLSLTSQFSPPSNVELLSGLQERRLDLLALKKGYQSQEQTVVAAVLDQFPRINLGFTRNVDNTRVRSLGFGVSIDIPIFDRNQGNIAIEKSTRQKLFDEYLSRVFDARADISQAIADITAINGQITDAQSALPALVQLVTVYKEASSHGNADVLSYYTAWNNLAQKNLDLLKLEQQLADNRVALELACGRYFPNDSEKAATRPDTTAPTTLPGVQP